MDWMDIDAMVWVAMDVDAVDWVVMDAVD